MKNVEICTKENSDSANKTVEIAVDQTYIKEGFLCHKQRSSELEPPKTMWKRESGERERERERGKKKQWRTTEEEDGRVEKTWKDVQAKAGNGGCWICFMEATCSEMEELELT